MLDILNFIFQDPWHFIGFILLWWGLLSPFHIHIERHVEKGGNNDGKKDDRSEEDTPDFLR